MQSDLTKNQPLHSAKPKWPASLLLSQGGGNMTDAGYSTSEHRFSRDLFPEKKKNHTAYFYIGDSARRSLIKRSR